MDQQRESLAALVRLLNAQIYSLPIYLRAASPWSHPGNEPVVETLRHVAADQQALGARIAAHLISFHNQAPRGAFPTRFTAFNDLSIDFLIGRAIDHQRDLLQIVAACARDLRGDPAGRMLAEEALGAAKGHLESLIEANANSSPDWKSSPGC